MLRFINTILMNNRGMIFPYNFRQFSFSVVVNEESEEN